jgi:hypothetical protein
MTGVHGLDQKFAEPVALSSAQPADRPLPRRANRLGLDLIALRARRGKEPKRSNDGGQIAPGRRAPIAYRGDRQRVGAATLSFDEPRRERSGVMRLPRSGDCGGRSRARNLGAGAGSRRRRLRLSGCFEHPSPAFPGRPGGSRCAPRRTGRARRPPETEVGGVVPVQVIDLSSAHLERELAVPPEAGSDTRSGGDLLGDPFARALFLGHDGLLPRRPTSPPSTGLSRERPSSYEPSNLVEAREARELERAQA